MAEMLANAGVNAIIGIGTVFCILLLISLIIYCFNIIPVLEKKFTKTNEVTPIQVVPKKVAPAPAPVVAADANDVPVAVIAAAIAAYEESNGYTGGGFYVRSIKRRR